MARMLKPLLPIIVESISAKSKERLADPLRMHKIDENIFTAKEEEVLKTLQFRKIWSYIWLSKNSLHMSTSDGCFYEKGSVNVEDTSFCS